ncbi:MAG TPA: hypothetical protein VFU43_04110 [Streptosporangiaceae bacterium]|nr:hypothetical protein [Streptosporangiaceae bacterium]
MTTTHSNTLASRANALAELRALAAQPPTAIADAFEAAERQARLLRDRLPEPIDPITACLTDLMPTIRVDHVDNLPVAGISFWGRGQWHIQVRASDPIDVQTLTILHELKHIIDHPLRREYPDLFSDDGWEVLAYHFAVFVLAYEPVHSGIKRKEEHL